MELRIWLLDGINKALKMQKNSISFLLFTYFCLLCKYERGSLHIEKTNGLRSAF